MNYHAVAQLQQNSMSIERCTNISFFKIIIDSKRISGIGRIFGFCVKRKALKM